MTRDLAFVLLVAIQAPAALAQAPSPMPSAPVTPAATCPECGVVQAVKRIEVRPPITAEERKSTSGLVASVPLGGGKPTVGSSTDVRGELKPPLVRYEVTVRLDDGRFQLVTQDDADGLRQGDKVRIDRGRVVLRGK